MDKSGEESNSSINIAKISFLIISLCLALFFGYLPHLMKIKKRIIRYLSFLNAFSGGIFLGVGLFILLPESKEISEEYFEAQKDKFGPSLAYELPYAFFFSFLSYSLLLLLEKVLFNTSMIVPLDIGELEGKESIIEPIDLIDEDEEEDIIKNVVSTKGKFASFLQIRNIRSSHVNDTNQPVDQGLLRSSIILRKTFQFNKNSEDDDNPDKDLFVNPEKIDLSKNRKNIDIMSDVYDHDHDHGHDHHHGKKVFSSLTPYLLLFALCLDGFFEGLAIGGQSSLSKILFVGFCLLVNKCIVACNLGISFKIAIPDLKVLIRFVLLFSLFTPFGIMVATIFYSYGALIKSAFLALASGSFIYVSSSVIIIEEFTLTKYKFTKFFLFLLGGICTAALIIAFDNK